MQSAAIHASVKIYETAITNTATHTCAPSFPPLAIHCLCCSRSSSSAAPLPTQCQCSYFAHPSMSMAMYRVQSPSTKEAQLLPQGDTVQRCGPRQYQCQSQCQDRVKTPLRQHCACRKASLTRSLPASASQNPQPVYASAQLTAASAPST